MTFAWDVASPADASKIKAFPANERAARTAARGSVDTEHSADEGRHKFPIGNQAARDAITNWQVGSLFFRNDVVVGQLVVDICESTGPFVWKQMGVVRLDEVQQWTKPQRFTWLDFGSVTGAQVLDLDNVPFGVTMVVAGDISFSNVSNMPAANVGQVFYIHCVQDATGSRNITGFGTDWRYPFAIQPDLFPDANSITQFSCFLGPDQKITIVDIQNVGV